MAFNKSRLQPINIYESLFSDAKKALKKENPTVSSAGNSFYIKRWFSNVSIIYQSK
jgi:hypothetical protein